MVYKLQFDKEFPKDGLSPLHQHQSLDKMIPLVSTILLTMYVYEKHQFYLNKVESGILESFYKVGELNRNKSWISIG